MHRESINYEANINGIIWRMFTLSVSTSAIISLTAFPSPILCFLSACSSSSFVMYLCVARTCNRFKTDKKSKLQAAGPHEWWKLPAVVSIKVLKHHVQMVLSFHSIHMHGGCYKLYIINGPISVNISLKLKAKKIAIKEKKMERQTE